MSELQAELFALTHLHSLQDQPEAKVPLDIQSEKRRALANAERVERAFRRARQGRAS